MNFAMLRRVSFVELQHINRASYFINHETQIKFLISIENLLRVSILPPGKYVPFNILNFFIKFK